MIKFEIIKDVEMNSDNGGEIIMWVSENNIKRKVGLFFDRGESLCDVLLLDDNENVSEDKIENVFSGELIERLWSESLIEFN
jgi:hypothetical protein|tara:strand:+ start:383 stop:628 length:246 start_codon:yes stop_codon:yes gene_type:complete